jgi:hypothetical protein
LALIIAVSVGVVVVSFALLLWAVGGRSIALSLGWIVPGCHDYLVRAWKAERAGRWADALAAYNEALDLDPRSEDARTRLENLLHHRPELADTEDGREALTKLAHKAPRADKASQADW